MSDIRYLHLPAEAPPPPLEGGPFRAVLVLEQGASESWRDLVSTWLVRSGCLYAVVWGEDCSVWHDSIDTANLVEFDFGDVPDDRFVMTTWHEDEPLAEAFWFAGHVADHPTVDLGQTVILHISPGERQADLVAAYHDAQESDD